MTLTKVKVTVYQVHQARNNWFRFFGRGKASSQEFYDFVDPERQTEVMYILYVLFPEMLECSEQIARRLDVLAGPHYHAYLMANQGRIIDAQKSWGKKPAHPWKPRTYEG